MNWRSRQQKLPTAIALITCVGSLSILLPKAVPNVSVAIPSTSVEPSHTQLTMQQLHQQAQALTVKVLSNEIAQGMSGGPLFNRRGEVVGINSSAVSTSINPT